MDANKTEICRLNITGLKLFPSSAVVQLEFDKIKALLLAHCRSDFAKTRAVELAVQTGKAIIDQELRQTHEYRQLLQNNIYFPNDFVLNLSRELRLLAIGEAILTGEQFLELRKLALTMQNIFRWFDEERKQAYPALLLLIKGGHYEKSIIAAIDQILDEKGQVKDNASNELSRMRMNLYRKRNELRRAFERIVSRLNKQGYLADIEESFMNGRRVVAIYAEQKRMIKGILHGESDTGRTAFVEPEETIELNNEIYSLEQGERKEVLRLLKQLTKDLSVHADLLYAYHTITGEYDFIRGKAKLALDMNAEFPRVVDRSQIHLLQAYHPLLFLYHKKLNKPTIPVSVSLDERNRILVISGPNAGGKTVTLKTVGLLQMMVQSGLLVPVHPSSEFGIFKQILIHIGDEQNLEFELSTYSSHLMNMKYFMENANGRTLFFIDELGSGSDPNLGGAFAEVILEELAKKHAFGIVTTHYLNLKVMANKTPGIINGAMAFDEQRLEPLYKLIAGKPGSSYTFAIAERIGLDKKLIAHARELVDEEHFELDKLLNRTEQDLQSIQQKEKELGRLMKENEKLRKELEQTLNIEKHRQQVELLREQNRVSEERIVYLKDMERKLKQVLVDWRKEEDKSKVIRQMQALLFGKNEKIISTKKKKKIEEKYQQVEGEIKIGDKVMMKRNHQVGNVIELRGKRAVVQIGVLPMQVQLTELVVVKEKQTGT
jgi:DNA mismatch repair protein MutS2